MSLEADFKKKNMEIQQKLKLEIEAVELGRSKKKQNTID